MIQTLGMVAGIMLPLWNIPLIVKIFKRKSSKDISLAWALGVWVCIVGMFPAALNSSDMVWKTFSIINFVLFTGVVIATLVFRKGEGTL